MALLAKYSFLGETSGYITLYLYLFVLSHFQHANFNSVNPITLSTASLCPIGHGPTSDHHGAEQRGKGAATLFSEMRWERHWKVFPVCPITLDWPKRQLLGAFPAQERAGPTSWTCSQTAFAGYSPGTSLPQLLCPLLTPVPMCCSTPLVVSLPLPIPFDTEHAQWSLYQ